VYPMRIASTKEKKVGLTDNRDFSDPVIENVNVEAGRIDGHSEKYSIHDFYDVYGLLDQNSPDLIKQASGIWNRDLAVTMNRNGLAYDQLPFFSGSHPVNRHRVGSGTFNNDITASADTAGFKLAYQAMMDILGYDGTRMNIEMGTPTVVVSSYDQFINFSEILNAGLYAKQVGAAAAGITTRLANVANLLYFPELADPTFPNSDKRWYLINTNHAMRRAFISRNLIQPQFFMTGPNDWPRHESASRLFYYEAIGGSGYGLPQLAIRCTLP